MGWLGIDDTDHINGGCTTHTLYRLICDLPTKYAYQNPRLVRLWPFAVQRTRGNAAVAIEILTEDNEDELNNPDNNNEKSSLPNDDPAPSNDLDDEIPFPFRSPQLNLSTLYRHQKAEGLAKPPTYEAPPCNARLALSPSLRAQPSFQSRKTRAKVAAMYLHKPRSLPQRQFQKQS